MSDRLAIVAGVGPGMGLALARRFAADGYGVALIARRPEALAGYLRDLGGGASAHPADLADPQAAAAAVAAIRAERGVVRALLWNAAFWRPTPAMSIAPEDFHRDLALGVTSALAAAQAVYPDMREAGGGAMLFTGGGLALAPQHGAAAPSLTAAKSALRGLVFALAGELRPQGVRVGTVTIAGTVAPGGPFDPDRIAARFAALAALPPDDPTIEVVHDGRD
jgi:NAD(P)-dependent dehydrogenase (short-subunit alcohol dehydrogenase family)